MTATWVEISAAAYAANLHFFRRLVGPDVELAAVVKANAYGHGWREIAGLAVRHGADSFCVHALDEALQLRRAGFDHDVLILGPVEPERLAEVVENDFRLVLYQRETAAALAVAAAAGGRRARVHLELETGTHRLGVAEDELADLLAVVTSRPELILEGVYTHFANIEDTTDHRYARQQLARFEALVAEIEAAAGAPLLRHAACSAAILVVPRTHYDMVRLGISQYGLWPSRETRLSYQLQHHGEEADGLRPVLSWKTRISQLKHVAADRFIGYGCTYQTTRATHLAVLPVGYADGYDRGLSNQAHVLVRGCRAPVRGRVCMNLMMVDVTDVPGVALGDEVVLLGRQGEQEITAGHLAGLLGTIAYEVVTRIGWELPRIVV